MKTNTDLLNYIIEQVVENTTERVSLLDYEIRQAPLIQSRKKVLFRKYDSQGDDLCRKLLNENQNKRLTELLVNPSADDFILISKGMQKNYITAGMWIYCLYYGFTGKLLPYDSLLENYDEWEKNLLNEAMELKYSITGDCHGKFDHIRKFSAKNKTDCKNVLIILGDLEVNFYLDWRDKKAKEKLSNIPITIVAVHGNHEERPFLTNCDYKEDMWNGGVIYYEAEFPNILFAKDGEVFQFGDKTAIVLGGAYSIDKNYRLKHGWPWFSSEQPDDSTKCSVEKNLEKTNFKVDYVLTHTCPQKFEPTEFFLPAIDQSTIDKSTEIWLDTIENRLSYSKWFAGHFHCAKETEKIQFLYNSIIELKTKEDS